MVTAVVMTTMDDPRTLTDQLRSLIQEIEDTEGQRLKDWNGDVSVLKVLDDYTLRFMKGEYGA